MQPEIRSFVLLLRTPLSRHLTVRILRKMLTVPRSGKFLATESVNSAPIKRGETKVQIFGKEKGKILRQY